MKSKRLWAGVAALLFLWLVVLLLRSRDAQAPRLTPVRFSREMVGTNAAGYDFLSAEPFLQGTMWVSSWGMTNSRTWLLGIDHRAILGEVVNGAPIFLDASHSRMIAAQLGGTPKSLREMLRRTCYRLRNGTPQGQAWLNEPQTLWLVNLQNNAATRLGELPRAPSNTYMPSPDLRFGLTATMGVVQWQTWYLFDLEQPVLTELPPLGWPAGWWTNTLLVVLGSNNDSFTYDVVTGQRTPFLSWGQIGEFFAQHAISDDPNKARIFTAWTGQGYEFYLTDTNAKWKAAETYLIKLERPAGKMRLIARQFKFEWSDSFDPTGRYYLYSGREAGDRSTGVFLRNLETGAERTLVEPTPEKYFSAPRFYGDSVIYVRSNALWQIPLDGRQTARLFPPPDKL